MEIKIDAKFAHTTYSEWDKKLQLSGSGREITIENNLTVNTDDLLAAVHAIRGGMDASALPN